MSAAARHRAGFNIGGPDVELRVDEILLAATIAACERIAGTPGEIDKQHSRAGLMLISWMDWPEPIQQWAAQELKAKGQYIPPPVP